MAINTQKVVVGGVVAGVVAFVLDFLLNGLLLAGRWEEAMNSLNPALAEGMESPGAMVGVVVLDLLWGIALVWLYAAIRPRFGPGAGTAFKAALIGWVLAAISYASLAVMGVFSWGLYVLGALCWLVVSVGAALIGGRLYQEDAA